MNIRQATAWISTSLLVMLVGASASAAERKYWLYDGGYFENPHGDQWLEHYHARTTYRLIEKNRVEDYVEIVDDSRNLKVRLYNDRQEQSVSGGHFRKLRDGGWGDKPPPPPIVKPTPATFSLCKNQTPIRNQGDRTTCPYFPPVAAIEAAYKRAGVNVELSEEHLTWLRDETAENDKVPPGAAENMMSTVGGGDASGMLTEYALCPAKDMPYHVEEAYESHTSNVFKGYGVKNYDWSKPFSQFVLNRWNLNPSLLSAKVRADARYGAEKVVRLSGDELHDPRAFEQILASGHEIIFEYTIHRSPIPPKGEPANLYHFDPKGEVIGDHFNLIVGYDRPRHFFIVKDSGGPIHYAAKDLSTKWKDVVKYDGFNLMDYGWLNACHEAYYIAEVAPVGSPRYTAQRALGQWKVSIDRKDKTLTTGILCWRRLPNHVGLKDASLRIGDLVTHDGQQFRVNAQLSGNGAKPYGLTLYINFANPVMPTGSTDASEWKGTINLPEKGDGTFKVVGTSTSEKSPWGNSKGMTLVAEQSGKKNLLKSMKPPKFEP